MPEPEKPTPTRLGHRLFLNPYEDAAFTRCPQCEQPTKLRKFYLVVHVEAPLLLVLHKRCRLCEGCDLLIVKQAELESLMAYAVEQRDPSLIGNDYLPLGTLDKADGRRAKQEGSTADWVVDRINLFRDKVHFEQARWEWVPPNDR